MRAATPSPRALDRDEHGFGDWLSRARVARGMTQQHLADASRIPRATIAQWETNRTRPKPAAVFALAAALGETPARVLAELDIEVDQVDIDPSQEGLPVPLVADPSLPPRERWRTATRFERWHARYRVAPEDRRDAFAYHLGDNTSGTPQIIPGDTLIVDPNAPASDGATVLALHDGRPTICRLGQRDGDWYLLDYHSGRRGPRATETTLLGRIVELRRDVG